MRYKVCRCSGLRVLESTAEYARDLDEARDMACSWASRGIWDTAIFDAKTGNQVAHFDAIAPGLDYPRESRLWLDEGAT